MHVETDFNYWIVFAALDKRRYDDAEDALSAYVASGNTKESVLGCIASKMVWSCRSPRTEVEAGRFAAWAQLILSTGWEPRKLYVQSESHRGRIDLFPGPFARELRLWLKEHPYAESERPLLPERDGVPVVEEVATSGCFCPRKRRG